MTDRYRLASQIHVAKTVLHETAVSHSKLSPRRFMFRTNYEQPSMQYGKFTRGSESKIPRSRNMQNHIMTKSLCRNLVSPSRKV